MSSEEDPAFTDADADAYIQRQVDDWYMVIEALNIQDLPRLEELARSFEGFPNGVDPWLGGHWIIHAIDNVNGEGVKWLLKQGVSLDVEDAGWTPLHSCIDRTKGDKHKIMRAIITAGADVNAEGLNQYTPLHYAAIRSDFEAIDILLESGADPMIATGIDNHATPEQEARILGKTGVADYLRKRVAQMAPKPQRFKGPIGLADPKRLV